jgi:hypothetical protein
MPDGSPTIQGGVVIITPNTDATTTQFQLLTALGADLSRIEVLSYIQEPETSSHSSSYRPFSLPQDLPHLSKAIERVDARLIILDPFLSLLSREQRCTNERLCHLLADLNQHLIERNVACLLIRNCPARGGHARPSVLERSDHFLTTAVSRLLLTHDPMQIDHLLLAHAQSRHSALTPTLSLQIQPSSANPDLPHLTILGTHSLQARDLIAHRPDSLHRRLLSRHLLDLIAAATNPIHVSTLYAHSHNSSPFQVQRSLNDLLRMGQIERPARGFYTPAPANATFPLNSTPATTPDTSPTGSLNLPAAITPVPELASILNSPPATTLDIPPTGSLNFTAATTSVPELANSLASTATTTPISEPASSFNTTGTITPKPKSPKRPHKGRNRQKNTKKRR